LNDSILIERALDGEQTAFRKLYDQHVDNVFRFLMQFSEDRELVADWVQQSFIKAFVKLDKFKGNSQFKTWLFSIAINEMRSGLRKQKVMEKLDSDTHKLTLTQQERDLDDLLSVRSAISKLDPNKRLVFLLHEVEGYSHREIAQILGVGESTSRTILSRTKGKLRETLTGE